MIARVPLRQTHGGTITSVCVCVRVRVRGALLFSLLCLLDMQLLHLLHPPQAAQQRSQRAAGAFSRKVWLRLWQQPGDKLVPFYLEELREQICCLFLHHWLDDAQKEQRFLLIGMSLLLLVTSAVSDGSFLLPVKDKLWKSGQ